MEGALYLVLVLLFISAIQAEKRRVYRSTDHDQCPQADFLPSVPSPDKHCVFSDYCSRAQCVVTAGPHKLTVILKINRCQDPLTATVTLQQPESNLSWSHTLKDGEKTKLDVTPSMFSGGLPVADASLFVQVGLKNTEGNNVNYTAALIGNVTTSDVTPVNVMLLQGKTAVWTGDCGMVVSNGSIHVHEYGPHYEDHTPKPWHPDDSHNQGACPPAHFTDGTVCPVTNHCSKITCTSPEDTGDGRMVLTVQINRCSGPLTATVTWGLSLSSEKWSHTFKNGDKAEVPMPSGSEVKARTVFKVELEETLLKIKFKLTISIKGIEESSEFGSVSTLTAKLPLSKCESPQDHKMSSGRKWFSRQPTSVKVVVILIPVLVLVFVGLAGVGLYCYKIRGRGVRYPVQLSAGGSKVAMQRLTNEI